MRGACCRGWTAGGDTRGGKAKALPGTKSVRSDPVKRAERVGTPEFQKQAPSLEYMHGDIVRFLGRETHIALLQKARGGIQPYRARRAPRPKLLDKGEQVGIEKERLKRLRSGMVGVSTGTRLPATGGTGHEEEHGIASGPAGEAMHEKEAVYAHHRHVRLFVCSFSLLPFHLPIPLL